VQFERVAVERFLPTASGEKGRLRAWQRVFHEVMGKLMYRYARLLVHLGLTEADRDVIRHAARITK
jgi:hypothetical protein